jgi:hypothetical protein
VYIVGIWGELEKVVCHDVHDKGAEEQNMKNQSPHLGTKFGSRFRSGLPLDWGFLYFYCEQYNCTTRSNFFNKILNMLKCLKPISD